MLAKKLKAPLALLLTLVMVLCLLPLGVAADAETLQTDQQATEQPAGRIPEVLPEQGGEPAPDGEPEGDAAPTNGALGENETSIYVKEYHLMDREDYQNYCWEQARAEVADGHKATALVLNGISITSVDGKSTARQADITGGSGYNVYGNVQFSGLQEYIQPEEVATVNLYGTYVDSWWQGGWLFRFEVRSFEYQISADELHFESFPANWNTQAFCEVTFSTEPENPEPTDDAELVITYTANGLGSQKPAPVFTVLDQEGGPAGTVQYSDLINGSFTLGGLKEGTYTVEISNTDVEGYTCSTVSDPADRKVTVANNGTATISFVSTYTKEEQPPVEPAVMTITKTFSGINDLPATFYIEIQKDGQQVAALRTTDGDREGNVYTWEVQLEEGEYTVEEKGYAVEGYTVMPQLDEKEGRTKSVIAMPDYDINVRFINTYQEMEQPPAEPAEMTVTKTFYGVNRLPADFTIEICKDGQLVESLNEQNGQRNNNVYTWTVELPEGEYTVEEKNYTVEGYTVVPQLDEKEGRTKSVIAMPDYDINVRFINTYQEIEQPPVKTPVLEIEKTADASSVTVGSNITYSITVKNTGDAAATNVTVTDTLPDGMTYVSSTENGAYANGSVTWNVGTLAAGASKTVTVTVRADSTGNLVNTASVDCEELTPVTDDAAVSVGSGSSGGGGGSTTSYYRVTVNYLDADGNKLAEPFVSSSIREGGSWNFSDKQLDTITVGDVVYTFAYADGDPLTGTNIRSNQTVNLYYETDTDIGDGETPLNPGPGGETDIGDGETPLNPGPGGETHAGGETNIGDGETPLSPAPDGGETGGQANANLPQTGAARMELATGAIAAVLVLAAALTAAGITLTMNGRKRKEH